MSLTNFVVKKRNWIVFAAFFFLVSFLRISSFFQSVVDWDESIYLLVADAMLNGQTPYTTIWDHKPPGIYVIFSLAQLVFGSSILSIRIAACIAISTTCYLLYRIGTVIGNDPKFGILAGILYAVYSLNLGGLASNTEIFFTPFVTLAFYLLFSSEIYSTNLTNSSYLKFFFIGLFMGIGLQIKYVVIFDFIAILFIVAISFYFWKQQGAKSLFAKTAIYLGTGFILPFLIVLSYFTLGGHFDDYFQANFATNVAYIGAQQTPFFKLITRIIGQIEAYLLLWISLFLTFLYLIFFKDIERIEKRYLIHLLIWFLLALMGVSITGRFDNPYYLQVLPVLCLIGAYIILSLILFRNGLDKAKQYFILALVLLPPLISNISSPLETSGRFIYNRYVKGIDYWGDNPAAVSHYLQERVGKEDYIYIVDYQPIIYHLVPARIPTKYALPYVFINETHSKLAGIDPVQELKSILEKRPVYIITIRKQEDTLFYTVLNDHLQRDYVLEKSFPDVDSLGTVYLYRLKTW